MSHALRQDYIDFDDYLTGERDVEVRSEFVDGLIYAMAGTFYAVIETNLKDECRVWQSDMKLAGKHQGKNFAYYPDIMATCSKNTGDQYVRSNPVLIVEVLSPSTQRTDLKEKFDNYITIPSLLEYVVIAQNTAYVRVFRRRHGWRVECLYLEDLLTLESVGLEIPITHIYRRVKAEIGIE